MTRIELIREARERALRIQEALNKALATQSVTLARYADRAESFTEFTERIAGLWGKQ